MFLFLSLVSFFLVLDSTAHSASWQLPSASQRSAWEEERGIRYPLHYDELDKDLFWIRKNHSAQEDFGGEGVTLADPPEASQQLPGDLLFFDLNFSPEEVRQIREVARIRGVKAHVFPERSSEQQRVMDSMYREYVPAQERFLACITRNRGSCEEETKVFDQKSKVFSDYIEKEIGRYGLEDFSRTLAQLHAQGVSPTVLVFSGHSGGGTSFGGFLGGLESADVHEELNKYPDWKKRIRSILLWGCYGGTFHGLQYVWKDHYPDLKLVVGYRGRSPLGHRPVSGRFLRNVLAQEKPLLEANSVRESHRLVRRIPDLASLDGTVLWRDQYITFSEAVPVKELTARCQSLTEEKVSVFRCFRDGAPGCENPPANHQGPLRELYSYLHRNQHCTPLQREKFPDLPTTDFVVRLIYLNEIKDNLARVRSSEIARLIPMESDLNLPAPVRLGDFQKRKRSEDVTQKKVSFSESARIGLIDGALFGEPFDERMRKLLLWEGARNAIDAPLLLVDTAYWRVSCIPLTWVDRGARDKDSCGLDRVLPESIGSDLEEQLRFRYFDGAFMRWADEFAPVQFSMFAGNRSQLKLHYAFQINQRLAELRKVPEPVEKTKQIIEGLESRRARLDQQGSAEFEAQLRGEISASIEELERLKERAVHLPFGAAVGRAFNQYQDRKREVLRRLED
jgi:hypothetical protein